MKFTFISLFMNLNTSSSKCVKCNYYILHNNKEKCQLFPTFENINMYLKTQTIHDIPHDYYSCDVAYNMCNGNNFSKVYKKSIKVNR